MELQTEFFLSTLHKISSDWQGRRSAFLSQEDFDYYLKWFQSKTQEKPITTPEELFDFYDNDPATALRPLIPLLALKSLSVRSDILVEGDLRLQKQDQNIFLFDGNLKIEGHLKYEGYVFIAGDLDVLGRIESLGSWPGLFVAGHIRTQAINQVTGAESDILVSTGDIRAENMIGSGNIQAYGRIESRLLIANPSFWKIADQAQFQYRLEPDYDDWFEPLKPEALKIASRLSAEINQPPLTRLADLITRIEKAIDEKRTIWI